MQYDRSADGKLTPLPKPSVDTGMGLERTAAVMQGVHSNYEIDLFVNIIRAVAEIAGTKDLTNSSLRVIADHIRACTFLVLDGVMPSNEGRGYVLRRIIRRAIRHGYSKLGITQPFFYKLVAALEKEMGDAYPALVRGAAAGGARAEAGRRAVRGDAGERHGDSRQGDRAAGRWRRGGWCGGGAGAPPKAPRPRAGLLQQPAAPHPRPRHSRRRRLQALRHLRFPRRPHERRRARARPHHRRAWLRSRNGQRSANDRGRPASSKSTSAAAPPSNPARVFQGYEGTDGEGARRRAPQERPASASHSAPAKKAKSCSTARLFYADSGGQVGDAGELAGRGVRFVVEDTKKRGTAHTHIGKLVEGKLAVGDTLGAHVDAKRRRATALNHTATHLMHAALRKVLGTHVTQKGSLVAPDRLRFDFSTRSRSRSDELKEVEHLVNEEIRRNEPAETKEMGYEDAVAAGAMALFGEKYEKDVRVLRIGEFSMELCGGTHVQRAGDIGFFKIVSEGGVAAGVRRIEAVTGEGALDYVEQSETLLKEVAGLVRGSRDDLGDKVRDALERIKTMEKEIRSLKDKLASGKGTDLASGAVDVQGVKVVATKVDGADAGALRNAVDNLEGSAQVRRRRARVGRRAGEDRCSSRASRPDLDRARSRRARSSDRVAAKVGGRGGGRPDFAQAGGTKPDALDGALADGGGVRASQVRSLNSPMSETVG